MFLLRSYLVFIVNLQLFTAACCQSQTKLTFLKLLFWSTFCIIMDHKKLQVRYNNAWFCKYFTAEWFWIFFLYSLSFFFKFYLKQANKFFQLIDYKYLYKLSIFIICFISLSSVLNLFQLATLSKAACFAWTPNNLAVLTLTSLLVINYFVLTFF